MGFLRAAAAGVTLAVLTAIGAPAWATNVESFDEAPAEVVVQAKPPCDGMKLDHARTRAIEHRQKGDFRNAAECYRVAGEHNMADRMLAEAFAASGGEATRKASATLDSARAQAKQMREAFRSKPASRRS